MTGANYARRRAAIAAQLDDDELFVCVTNPEHTYSNDVHFPFRPASNFWYLTGFAEPDSALVIRGDSGAATLYLREREAAREVWDGRRLGVANARDAIGVDAAKPWDALLLDLQSEPAAIVLDCPRPEIAANVLDFGGFQPGTDLVQKLRMCKDPHEIACLQRAVEIGSLAMRRAFAKNLDGGLEQQLSAALLHCYEELGTTGPGYAPIVGSGANAAVLHYIENRGRLRSGEFTLIDAGCGVEYYTSDLTRTWPVDGKFTEQTAAIYDIVADAQHLGIEAVAPGKTMADIHRVVSRRLVEGLVDLQWLRGDADELLESGAHKPYYMHSTGHLLGLDVHDCVVKGEGPLVLEPGMVLTVEPGLYVNHHFAPQSAHLPELGIRLENDVVVTEDGHLDLSRNMPSARDAFDSWIGAPEDS